DADGDRTGGAADPHEDGWDPGGQRRLQDGEHRHRERSGSDGDEQHGEITPHRSGGVVVGGAVASDRCACSSPAEPASSAPTSPSTWSSAATRSWCWTTCRPATG